MKIPPVKSHVGEFLKRYLRNKGITQRDFVSSEPVLDQSHLSKILTGIKRQIRPETIDAILVKLDEDARGSFIEAYTLDQLTNEKYHHYVTGRVRDTVSETADPFDLLAAHLRSIYRPPERAEIAKLAKAILEGAARSKELRGALKLLMQMNVGK